MEPEDERFRLLFEPAMRRRARSTVWARVKAWVGAWISMRASCSTKSSRLDEFAGEPQAGAGVLEMGPADKPLGDRARPYALIEAGERILGGGERAQSGTRQRPIRGCRARGLAGVTRAARRHRSRRLGRGPA